MAHFFTPSPEEHILDLGTGCGIIALLLAGRWPSVSVTGLEVQAALAALARRNFAENGLESRVRLVEGDLREMRRLFGAAEFSRVVCNPPYRRLGAARPNPDPGQAIARHEIMADLEEIVRAADWVLAEGGRLDFVYPAERAAELQMVLAANGCTPARLREVYSYPGGPGRLVLVEAVKGERAELQKLPPLYVQTGPAGVYSQEMAAFYKT